MLTCAALAIAATGLPPRLGDASTHSSEERIVQLIEQLGDQDYFVRQRAQSELAKFSFEAFAALTAATTHEDLEVAARARYLLRLMRVEWTVESDPPEVKKLLADYEVQDLPRKIQRMRALAGMADGKGIPALCRLVRYERSPVLSKYAAIELLNRQPLDEPPTKKLAEQVRKSLGSSSRTAASWLLTYVQLRDDPDAMLTGWDKLVEAELSRLQHAPAQTSDKIVADLLCFQIEWLKKLEQKDKAVAAIRRLVDLKQGDAKTLSELLLWLVEQEARDVVDELTVKLAPRFSHDPILLYAVARALADAGDPQRAGQTAALALRLVPGNDSGSLRRHYAVARELQRRGWFPWAEDEYRHVIDRGGPIDPAVVAAQFILAEMFHDQGQDFDAAKVLEALAETCRKQPKGATEAGINSASVRSRMNFFHACHFQGKQDRAQQRAYLDKARQADATDVDVLIACYRLPDQTAQYREEILTLIKESAARLHQRIAERPNEPMAYNQFAWLVGNTEGDLDEALKCSKTSIELSPGNGGYYDTLAHVYFGKGDYENAVKTQTKAAELEPHSGLIARQLEVFRKKWQEQKKEP